MAPPGGRKMSRRWKQEKFHGQHEPVLIDTSTGDLIVLLGLLFNTIWNRRKCIDDLSLQKANISHNSQSALCKSGSNSFQVEKKGHLR